MNISDYIQEDYIYNMKPHIDTNDIQINKKKSVQIESELGDNFEVIELSDIKKDLQKISKKENDAMKYHDKVRTIKKTQTYANTLYTWYSWGSTTVSVVKSLF